MRRIRNSARLQLRRRQDTRRSVEENALNFGLRPLGFSRGAVPSPKKGGGVRLRPKPLRTDRRGRAASLSSAVSAFKGCSPVRISEPDSDGLAV